MNAGPVERPSSMNDMLVFEGALEGRMNVGMRAWRAKEEAEKRKVTVTGVWTKLGSSESGLSSPSLPWSPSSSLPLSSCRNFESRGEARSSSSTLGGAFVPLVQVLFPSSKTLLGGTGQSEQL